MSDELRALAEAATPGPWRWLRYPGIPDPNSDVFRGLDSVARDLGSDDAAFIAAANPTAVLALLAEVEALRGVGERVRALADEWGNRSLPISAEFENAIAELHVALAPR